MMIKGCEKKMIVVKGEESSPFESAYFVLRHGSDSGSRGGDILREANRIIAESCPVGIERSRRREKIRRILFSSLFFLLGGITGCGIALLAVLFP